MPTLIVTGINFGVPQIIKALVSFESWDFPETIIQQKIWRIYILKFTNLAIYTLLSYDGLYNIEFFNHFFGTSFGKDHGDHIHSGSGIAASSQKCKYDKVGVDLITLIATETVVLFGKEIGKAFLFWIFKGKILGRMEWRNGREAYLPDFVIWMLYNKAV